MDDRVGPLEMGPQIVHGDVRRNPAGVGGLELRSPTGYAHDRLDLVVATERGQHAGADVPARSDHHDAHAGRLPEATAPKRRTDQPWRVSSASRSDSPAPSSPCSL